MKKDFESINLRLQVGGKVKVKEGVYEVISIDYSLKKINVFDPLNREYRDVPFSEIEEAYKENFF